MITSKLFRTDHPSRVAEILSDPEGQQSGLLNNSVVMTDNLATIYESEIDRVIGMLPIEKVDLYLPFLAEITRLGVISRCSTGYPATWCQKLE